MIMPMEEDEYELIPLSPLRKIEKRLDKVERGSSSQEMVKELIDVVRTNQQIVDDIVKINSDTVSKITELTISVNQMVFKIEEFINRIEVTGTEKEEEKKEGISVSAGTVTADARLDKLEKRINTLLLATAARNKLRTSAAMTRRPPIPGLSRP